MLQNDIEERTVTYFSENRSIKLPPIFKDILKHGRSKEEMAILALASLVTAGSLMSNVRFRYKHSVYSPHMFFFVVGNAGCGKSMALHPIHMLKDVIKKYDEINHQRFLDFERRKYLWEEEKRKAREEGREPDFKMEPEKEPELIVFNCPDSISKSQLLHNLYSARNTGMIQVSSEAESVVSAANADYGKHIPELRKVAMNEPVGIHYKVDGHPVVVDFPMLTMVMTGTPDQLVKFVPNTDDGMYSRLAILYMESKWNWDPLENDKTSKGIDEEFEALAPYMLQLHEYLIEYPTMVKFSAAQRKRFNAFFSKRLDAISIEANPAYHSIIVRSGINFVRIASTLTGIRKFDNRITDKIVECNDADFMTSMIIIENLIEHSLLVSTMLPECSKTAKEQGIPLKFFFILAKIDNEFSLTDYSNIAIEQFDICKRTAERSLKNLVEKGYVELVQRGVYRKTDLLKDYLLHRMDIKDEE